MIYFDHIEIHVSDPLIYCEFLVQLLDGGRFEKISENGTYMFMTNDLHRFEIKALNTLEPFQSNLKGFCMPCLRTKGALNHLKKLKIEPTSKVDNPDGICYFFEDSEGIKWHIKDYLVLDKFVNI
jgi:hypothetical protein